ncbi:MAG TPA: UbiX family flavin prenyltransferase [Anaerolineales bacterium]|nr:UbiX family flavin prenyltransferase [Anaerolineales bacterium]
MNTRWQPFILGISGASGVILGIRMLEELRKLQIETHLVLTKAAEQTILFETNYQVNDVQALAYRNYPIDDIGAVIASGSQPVMGMAVVPCSIKSLSAIANAYSADLLTRAADVTLKEGRPLLLAVRETPLHAGHIRLLQLAANAGAILFPPVPAFYTNPQTVDEIISNIVGRILMRMGITNNLYQPWKPDLPHQEIHG